MADRTPAPDTPELRARWGSFAFTKEWKAKADASIAKYPDGRQKSAVMALLDFAQQRRACCADRTISSPPAKNAVWQKVKSPKTAFGR